MSDTRQRKRKKPQPKINHTMRGKLVGLFAVVILALVCLLGRITYINATSGTKYKKRVLLQAQQTYQSSVLPAKRGDIYDRNGNILATSQKVYSVIMDCKEINDEKHDYVDATVKALVEVLGLDEEDIRSRLTDPATSSSQYQILKKELTMDQKKAFEEYKDPGEDSGLSDSELKERANIQGIWFEEDYLRIYPFNDLACDTIGFTLSRETADSGLEGYYNSTLMGTDGRQYGYINDESDAEQTIMEPVSGDSIETSLDVGAQQIVEKYVNGFKASMGAKNIGVIAMKPSTGEIIAMDGGDRYDLNEPRDMSEVYSQSEIDAMSDEETVTALNAMWSNFCVTDAFEAGSVVKPIVMAGALEKGKISASDTFTCDGGETFGANGDTYIKCAVWPDAHGTETLREVIANSCNDGMMQIAARMGTEAFLKAQSLFNFGSRTGIDLPNEGAGVIHTTETMGETELACSAFGQGFTCTMLQEINAMCSVINGGYYYQPHLVTAIKDSSGGTVRTIDPILLKQTISSDISADIRSYMQASVQEGTSRTSKIQGYSSGGKTGTAEKLPRGNKKYIVSFITFAPVDDPQVLLYVVVDEPNAEEQADSKYPQYIAQGILSELLPYLNVAPDESEDGVIPKTELWEGFNGKLVDVSGSSIDESGNLTDGNGNLVDLDGNRIDTNGYLLQDNGDYVTDENGQYVKSQNLGTTIYAGSEQTENDLKEAISDTNVPEPPQDDEEDTRQDNNMESEGLTNEEAGLD